MIDTVIRFAVSVFPVVAFLVSLVLLDSYKLVTFKSTCAAAFFGLCAAVASFLLSTVILGRGSIAVDTYARYVAPPIEESLKLCYVVFLMRTKRIGFMVDAAIYGFAIGAGFAVVENIYFLSTLSSSNILLWVIRGFGTAVMHGGTTALTGIIAVRLSDHYRWASFRTLAPGFLIAVGIHSAYNHFLVSPIVAAVAIVVALPAAMVAVFRRSELGLRQWLGVGFDSDSQLLEMITTGDIAETRIGHYLMALKRRFPGEVVADMLCLIRLHVELALKAKGVLLMREAGFAVGPDADVKEKFTEMHYLEKHIGRTGLLALEPILHWSNRDLWQLYMLGKR
jgi:RsiW-degrading membrane proteinase PrsW (M82 family)